jgi:acylpyruvate hydrolase
MRLATVRTPEGTRAAAIYGEEAHLLPYDDVRALLEAGVDPAAVEPTAASPVAGLDYAPLVSRPEKVICAGLNYANHAAEADIQLPEYPTLFAKFGRSLVGAGDPIVLPHVSAQADWEVELGVVIGSPVRNADRESALDAVAGYTVFNDVSMRDWQTRTSQYLQGKAFEASSPVGPHLVSPSELDGSTHLRLTCTVNGVVWQDDSTSNMVFDVAELISYISTFVTLVPGDIIATGTPAGVGAAADPPVFLKPGDVVQSSVERVGSMSNVCEPEPALADTAVRDALEQHAPPSA